MMGSRQAAIAPFDEARWASRAFNLDPTAGRHGVHDEYSTQLPLRDGEASSAIWLKASDALLRYRIFPPDRMRAHVSSPDGVIRKDVTIVQRVFLGPVAMEMAVRVLEVFDVASGPRRVGFTYATLQGHSERGLATFSVREAPDGSLLFAIESWSSPGNILAMLGRPIARRVQRGFTGEALAFFHDHFRD
jgi:uncharacterized protein (UPF0548 family)